MSLILIKGFYFVDWVNGVVESENLSCELCLMLPGAGFCFVECGLFVCSCFIGRSDSVS